jgi:hypothetical protein
MGDKFYTEDMADIFECARERRMVLEILKAWESGGLPSDFDATGVKLAFNRNSGNVFLVNEEFQVAMVEGLCLESFYSSPYEGREGFFTDLLSEYPTMHREDQEWFRDIAKATDKEGLLPAVDDE